MGRFFFDCPGGKLIYSCKDCLTHLSNIENVISDKFRGATGTAYLFDNVINVEYAGVELKTMLTGKHMVRDAYCKNCKARVGWMYEFAYDAEQEYKEGKVILERALIQESMGIDDKLTHGSQSTIGVAADNRAQQDILDRSQRNSSSSSLSSNASLGSGSSGSSQGVPIIGIGARINPRLSTSASQTGVGGFGAQMGVGVGPLGSRHMPVRFMVRWGGENPQEQGHHTGQFGTSYSSGTSSSSSSGGTGRVAQSSGTGRSARMAGLMDESSTSSSSSHGSESRASSHSGSPSITSSTSSASIRGSGGSGSSAGSSPEEARRRGPTRGSPVSGGGGAGGGSSAIRFGRRSLRFSRGSSSDREASGCEETAMGRPFLEHMGGKRYYTCERCDTYLTNKKEIISHAFRGATGQAYLFRTVVNIGMAKVESRYMLTGRHLVRDVYCKNCLNKLGWMYEFAHDTEQAYKEGNVILERKLLHEVEETDPGLSERNRPMTRTSSTSSVSSSGISSVTIT